MSKEAQDFERWIREKLRTLFTNTPDESKVVDADPPGDHIVDANKMLSEHVTDVGKLIKETNTEDK